MAIDAARRFLEEMGRDANLQEEVTRAIAAAADRFAALALIGSKRGFDATADEIKAAVEAAAKDGALSDDDLAKVAGGVGIQPVGTWGAARTIMNDAGSPALSTHQADPLRLR